MKDERPSTRLEELRKQRERSVISAAIILMYFIFFTLTYLVFSLLLSEFNPINWLIQYKVAWLVIAYIISSLKTMKARKELNNPNV